MSSLICTPSQLRFSGERELSHEVKKNTAPQHECADAARSLRLDRATLAALAVAAVVMGLGQTTLFTFLPLLLERTGLSLARITAGFALGSGLFIVGAPLWSRLSDRLGRRAVVTVALCGFLVSHALLLWQMRQGAGWGWQDETLWLNRVIYGLTVSGLIPTCQAWLADLTSPDQRLGALSKLSAGLTLGRLIGPPLAAASLWLDPLGPLWLVTAAPLLALPLLPFARVAPPAPAAAAGQPFDRRALLVWLGFALAMQMALGQVQYTIGPWLGTRFGLEATAASAQLGWMLTGCALVVMALQLGVVPRCKPGRPLLIAGGVAMGVCGLLLALSDSLIGVWLGFLALGVAAALLVPTYTALASLATGQSGQSRVAGAIAAAHTVGFSLAAALAGLLFGWWTTLPFWLTAALGLSVLAGAALVRLPAKPA